ncbi:MAG: hypothetical protein IJ353_09500 [Lachnospiraceae bacterium]|nr:hypothetical protein [Lachnospiraceae bacterium]
MTSRNSFFNLLKEDLHRRLWTLILSSLVFFGTFGVAFTMIVQNYVGRYSRVNYGYTKAQFIEMVSSNLCEDFYSFFPWFMAVAIIGAIICAMNGFAYLHSRKQMDFYHSLPVKREKIFAVRLVNGVLIYALPYLVGLLYTYVLCLIYGVMTWDIFFCGLFMFVLHLMGYLIMYLAGILAMMLTGKLVIAFFGICIVNLYAPAVYALFWVLKDTFFITAYSSNMDFEIALSVTRWFSPFSYYFSLVNEINGGGRFWLEFLAFLVFAAALAALNLWLYKKRASEKADTAMAFKITEPIVRFMIAVPVGILAGMLFFSIQYDYGFATSVLWLVFGGLLGGFLCHGIIEAFYKGDIKKCLSHKVQMLITMVLAAVIPLAFMFDIFGYDSYLPQKKDIKNMAVISSEMRFGGSYYDENGWIGPVDYALENMKVTNIDAMYELVEILAEDAGKHRAERFYDYGYNYVTVESSYGGSVEKYNPTNFVIRYTLKDGSEVIRKYEYNYYAVMDLLEQIYNDNEYKSAVHPVFGLLKTNVNIKNIEIYSPVSIKAGNMQLNGKAVLEAYEEDLLAMTFDDLKNSAPIGELTVVFTIKENGQEYDDSTNFLVYPEMIRTLDLLRVSGYQMKGIADAANVNSINIHYSGSQNDLKRILGMEVSEEETEKYYEEMSVAYEDYEIYYEKYGYYPPTVASPEYYQDIVVEFTDPAEIAEIKKHLIYRSYGNEFGPFPTYETFLNVEAYFEMQTGTYEELLAGEGLIGWSERFRFREGEIPQFVIDRLFEQLGAENY